MGETRTVAALLVALDWPAEDVEHVTVFCTDEGGFRANAGKAAFLEPPDYEPPDGGRWIEVTAEEAIALVAAGADAEAVDRVETLRAVLEVSNDRSIHGVERLRGDVWIARSPVPLGNTNDQVKRVCLITAQLAKELGY